MDDKNHNYEKKHIFGNFLKGRSKFEENIRRAPLS